MLARPRIPSRYHNRLVILRKKNQLSVREIPHTKYIRMRKTSFDNSASFEPFNECVCHGIPILEKGACLNLTADLSEG